MTQSQIAHRLSRFCKTIWAAMEKTSEYSFFEQLINILSILEFKVDEMPLIVLWLIVGKGVFHGTNEIY